MSRMCTFLFLFLWTVGCTDPVSEKALLPMKGEVKGWDPHGAVQYYEGEDLFIYINGGADIYYEYGFSSVTVQEYRNAEGGTINLEIYRMKDARGAFGIYSFKTGTEGMPVTLGDRAYKEDYYLNLWKGKYLITLTALDESRETLDGLVHLAQGVDKRIHEKGQVPEVMKKLPTEDLIPESDRYIMGHLGLFNTYPFFTKDRFQFQEAVVGTYKGGDLCFLLRYMDEHECNARFEEIKKAFYTSSKYQGVMTSQLGIPDISSVELVEDAQGQSIMFFSCKTFVVLVIRKDGGVDFTGWGQRLMSGLWEK